MPTVLTIYIYKDGQLTGTHHFDSRSQRVVKIGRIGSADVQIDEREVARVHAVIELTHAQAKLIDMGSQAGTFVNGARASKAVLKSDDQVVIGNTGLLVGVDVQRDVLASPAPAPIAPIVPAPAGAPPPEPPVAAMPLATPAVPPSPAPEATPHAPSPNLMQAERIATKVAALPPASQETVERFIDLLASRPAGINIYIGDTMPLTGDVQPPRDLERRDTDSMIAVSGIGNKRRIVAVAAVAVGVIVLGFVGARLWDKEPTPPRDPWSLDVAKNGAPPKSTDGEPTPDKAASPDPEPEPRDPSFVYVELTVPMSLRELATALWPNVDRAPLLLENNPTATGLDDDQAAGSTVRIPRKLPVRVQPGDSLALIAENTLGDAQLYPVIFEANQDVMSSPSAVEVGMRLEIPLVHEAVRTKLSEIGKVEPDL